MPSSQFLEAVDRSKDLSERPSNDILLKLYALYKQATEGDAGDDRPSGFDFKAIAKYDAWVKQRGKSNQEAENEYIALISSLS